MWCLDSFVWFQRDETKMNGLAICRPLPSSLSQPIPMNFEVSPIKCCFIQLFCRRRLVPSSYLELLDVVVHQDRSSNKREEDSIVVCHSMFDRFDSLIGLEFRSKSTDFIFDGLWQRIVHKTMQTNGQHVFYSRRTTERGDSSTIRTCLLFSFFTECLIEWNGIHWKREKIYGKLVSDFSRAHGLCSEERLRLFSILRFDWHQLNVKRGSREK